MNKRNLFAAIAALVLAPTVIGRSEAAGGRKSATTFAAGGRKSAATFVVPKGVTKLRVRSYRGNDKIIDTALNVVPGQIFTIDAV